MPELTLSPQSGTMNLATDAGSADRIGILVHSRRFFNINFYVKEKSQKKIFFPMLLSKCLRTDESFTFLSFRCWRKIIYKVKSKTTASWWLPFSDCCSLGTGFSLSVLPAREGQGRAMVWISIPSAPWRQAESIEWFIEDQALSPSYDLAPAPSPSPPFPSTTVISLSQSQPMSTAVHMEPK